jgi:hypothetical protein
MPAREHVVHPEGELDIATVPPLGNQWLRAIDQEQPELFVVDLRGVTYLGLEVEGRCSGRGKDGRRRSGPVRPAPSGPTVSAHAADRVGAAPVWLGGC